ncbi:membrane protein YczE [Amycolatopsis pithecellobii]|uniref:YitT family protein n=1 Tax=Amycolatopsis pithecellobii TaxID=664692 RepID=A0A6N7ZAH7_9PSEU|nr:hypothetical protein [Amycolatopsis pithecellobii]MTD58727.1 hypothetical protein [Amycolatopsis pithecellobii]
MASIELGPVRANVNPQRRFPQLLLGLILFGTSTAMMSRASLGFASWDVLHDGLTKRTGLTFGTVTALTAVAVLLLWFPLRQRPGIGTVLNVILTSAVVDLVRAVLPQQHSLRTQIPLLVGGIVLNALATALYIGTRLGPGPRDGLMTGLVARTGFSVRLVRSVIEILVLATGWLLGGSIGLTTVLYVVAIGPLVQVFLPRVAWRHRAVRN